MPDTQTTPATQAPATPPAITEQDGPVDIDVRAAQLVNDIREGKFGTEEDGGEEAAEATPAETPESDKSDQVATAKGPGEEEDDEPQKPETDVEKERKERIARAQELERQAREDKRVASDERRKNEEIHSKLASLEKQLSEREKQLAEREKQFVDPAYLLPMLRKHLTPQQLGEFLTEELNPSTAAEWAVRRAQQKVQQEVSPELQTLREEVNALKREKLDAAAHERAASERQRAEQEFVTFAKEATAETPYAKSLLASRPEELLKRAHATAARLVAEHGETNYDAILREVESELSGFASLFSLQPTGENATSESDSSAAAQAPRARTLTNRNSAGRSTIVDEDLGTLEDRAEELKRRLRKSG